MSRTPIVLQLTKRTMWSLCREVKKKVETRDNGATCGGQMFICILNENNNYLHWQWWTRSALVCVFVVLISPMLQSSKKLCIYDQSFLSLEIQSCYHFITTNCLWLVTPVRLHCYIKYWNSFSCLYAWDHCCILNNLLKQRNNNTV